MESYKSVNKVVLKKEKRNQSEMAKDEEPKSKITHAQLLQLKKVCLVFFK